MAKSALTAEVKKALDRALRVGDSRVATVEIMDFLTGPGASIEGLMARYPDLEERDLRNSFGYFGELLMTLEDAAGATTERPARPKAATKVSEKPLAVEPKPSIAPVASGKILIDKREAVAALPEALVYSDGASKGNPGKSGIGFVIVDKDDSILFEYQRPLGLATNNEAEYLALIAAMEHVLNFGQRRARFHSDSELVVHQVAGRWQIKKLELAKLVGRVTELRKKFDKFALVAIPREDNVLADELASSACKLKV